MQNLFNPRLVTLAIRHTDEVLKKLFVYDRKSLPVGSRLNASVERDSNKNCIAARFFFEGLLGLLFFSGALNSLVAVEAVSNTTSQPGRTFVHFEIVEPSFQNEWRTTLESPLQDGCFQTWLKALPKDQLKNKVIDSPNDKSEEDSDAKRVNTVDQFNVECPVEISKLAEQWMKKVLSSHELAMKSLSSECLNPVDIDLLLNELNRFAYSEEIIPFDKTILPPLGFKIYACGTVESTGTSTGLQRVVLNRLVIHCTPSPLATFAIRKKLAMPAVWIDKSGPHATDFIDIRPIGSDEFEKNIDKMRVQQSPTHTEYLKTMCTGTESDILAMNRRMYQKWKLFLETFEQTNMTADKVKAEMATLIADPIAARRAALMTEKTISPKLQACIKHLFTGTSSPLLELNTAEPTMSMWRHEVDDKAKELLRNKFFVTRAYLAIDLEGVWIVDGYTSLDVLKVLADHIQLEIKPRVRPSYKYSNSPDNMPEQESVPEYERRYAEPYGSNQDKKSLKESDREKPKEKIANAITMFTKLLPEWSRPTIPNQPESPFSIGALPTLEDAGEVLKYRLEGKYSSSGPEIRIFTVINLIVDSESNSEQNQNTISMLKATGYSKIINQVSDLLQEELDQQTTSYNQRVADYGKAAKSGEFNNNPKWIQYQSDLRAWKEKNDAIEADWVERNEKLRSRWAVTQPKILDILSALEKHQIRLEKEKEMVGKSV